ncbi:polysaccharide deacetylase [Nitrospira sp.]|nr:polysaccharide deacetylase [Nitrospira sp.]
MQTEPANMVHASASGSITARAIDWLRRKLIPTGIILLYHRIAEGGHDPWGMAVSPVQFDEHLQVLRRFGTAMTLNEFLSRRFEGQLRERAIMVTFDGTYASTLTQAVPSLTRFETPATVFVRSGMVGCAGEHWRDELERLLLESGPLPQQLILTISETKHRWSLEDSGCPQIPQAHHSWRVWDAGCPTARHALYRELCERLASMDDESREDVLGDLRRWAGNVSRTARESHRLLTWGEVSQLGHTAGIDIGGQGLTHSSLAALTPREQWQEILQGKALLETALSVPAKHFAFPQGRRDSYTRETIAFVRAAGYVSASTTEANRIERWTDPFELPRFSVHAQGGEEFATWLSAILAA